MLRFTTAHSIPFNIQEPVNNFVLSTVIGHQIWILFKQLVSRDTRMTELAVFDTKTHESTILNCELPNVPGFSIYSMTSNVDQLYITLKPTFVSSLAWPPGRSLFLKIFKFDTKTLTYCHVQDLHADIQGSPQVVGNYMYFLSRTRHIEPTRTNRRVFPRTRRRRPRRISSERGGYQLIKIDLSGNHVVDTTDLLIQRPCERYKKLFANNGRLYLLGNYEGQRVISMIDNDNCIVPIFEAEPNSDVFITKWFTGCLISRDYLNRSTLFLNALDFITYQWNKQIIEGPCDKFCNEDFKTAELIDSTLFAVTASRPHHHPDKRDCVIRVMELELKPKLSSICLLQLVDDLLSKNDNETIDGVVERLPIPMRPILSNMLEWRNSLLVIEFEPEPD